MSTARLSRLRAEHLAWTIERTPGRQSIGYTATRQRGGAAEKVSTVNLTELEKRLRSLDNPAVAADSEARDKVWPDGSDAASSGSSHPGRGWCE